MPIFTKGKRIGSDPLYKEISEKLDRPSEFSEAAKKRIEELRIDAQKLEVTFATEGWIDIIQPLIDSEANPGKTFELFESDKSEKAKYMAIGRAKAFHSFNMMLKNIIATLQVPIEEKGESK